MTNLKKVLETRFKHYYPKKRLLAVQLNGFSHKVFFDNGKAEEDVMVHTVSFYAPEQNWKSEAIGLFEGIPHHSYQGSGEEVVWVYPNQR